MKEPPPFRERRVTTLGSVPPPGLPCQTQLRPYPPRPGSLRRRFWTTAILGTKREGAAHRLGNVFGPVTMQVRSSDPAVCARLSQSIDPTPYAPSSLALPAPASYVGASLHPRATPAHPGSWISILARDNPQSPHEALLSPYPRPSSSQRDRLSQQSADSPRLDHPFSSPPSLTSDPAW